MTPWVKWAIAIILTLALLKVLVWWLQPRLAFAPKPDKTPPPPAFSRFEATAEDGVRVTGWVSPFDDSLPVILYFCGNAGNLSDRADLLTELVKHRLGVVAFNYRGTGESEGMPSEDGLYRDAEAVLSYLTTTCSVVPARIVLWGHSIGGAVAAHLAGDHPCAGVILESTFLSAAKMSKRIIPVIPLQFFLTYRFDNQENVARLTVPLLLIHGTADQVVPPSDSKRLFELASCPKDLWLVEGAGHNDICDIAGADFYQRIADFSQQATAR